MIVNNDFILDKLKLRTGCHSLKHKTTQRADREPDLVKQIIKQLKTSKCIYFFIVIRFPERLSFLCPVKFSRLSVSTIQRPKIINYTSHQQQKLPDTFAN